MAAVKHLLRYLQGSRELELKYSQPGNRGLREAGDAYADWAGCPDSRQSTSGYALMLNGAAISWKSKRQPVVALSLRLSS